MKATLPMKANKKKWAKSERFSITAFVLVVILLLFGIVILTVSKIQYNNVESTSLKTLRSTVSEVVKPKAVISSSVSDKGKFAIRDDTDNSNDFQGKGEMTGIVVYRTVDDKPIWLKGEKEDYQTVYDAISQTRVEEGSYTEYKKGDYFVGIYSATYFNEHMKLPIEPGEHDYSLKTGSAVYSCIDASEKINLTRQMTLTLTFVLLAVDIALIVPIYLISGLLMKPTLDAMEREKVFVANASHELKTPLAIISANASVLAEKHPDDFSFVENINQQCKNMNETIIDMIDLSKLETKEPVFEKVNLSELLFDLCLSFDAVAFENEIIYEYDIEEKLVLERADKKNLTRMFNLLIDNAMKYVDGKEKRINISLKKEGRKYHFRIKNSGCEVQDEDREKVFDRFYQGKSGSDKERKGSGLGLAIVHQICETYGYEISIDSHFHDFMEFDILIN